MSTNNLVSLTGRVGKTPTYVTTEQGNDLTRFSLATHSYRTGADGKRQVHTQWHRCIAWGPMALKLHEHLDKGKRLSLNGSIKYGRYTDKNGHERQSTDIVVKGFIFID